MKIDCLSREPHHQKHSRQIFDNLPDDIRGDFYSTFKDFQSSKNDIVLCSAFSDLREVNRVGKKAIYTEHGVGLYYNVVHPSYAGSKEARECVILRLSPNERHAQRERETLTCPIEVVGVPYMDKWADYVPEHYRLRKAIVAVSFHFDANVCPETRSGFSYFIRGLKSLSREYKILGHGHPRIFSKIRKIYERNGIEPVKDFDEVMKRSNMYMCDNSSTIWEYAFTNRPVILLNPPFYRKWVTHKGNPRFWEYADIGYNVDKPEQLQEAVELTYKNHHDILIRQKQIVQNMFTYTDGTSTQRAIEAIIKHTQ